MPAAPTATRLLLLSVCAFSFTALDAQTYKVNHPDRRPLRPIYISDFSYSTANNPRGYKFATSYNINTDDAAYDNFQSLASTYFAGVISSIQAAAVQPQGVILWDVEGQEFTQPGTSYVGDPRWFAAGYAPEMNAAIDFNVKAFQNAGYSVGLTLRPQQVFTVTSLPSTCAYSAVNDYNAYYLHIPGAFGSRFYGCNSNGTSYTLCPTGCDSGIGTDPGGQTFYPQSASSISQITALLSAKVAYAQSRWGINIFYIDTSVYHGGGAIEADIFQALITTYPNALFIPEESDVVPPTYPGYASTTPYSEPNIGGPVIPAPAARAVYPLAVRSIILSSCTETPNVASCWTPNVATLTNGVTIGDINMYSDPNELTSAQISMIESMITAGLAQAGMVTVTDSSTSLSYMYNGVPATIQGTYPVKMRVYFAATDAGLPTSTTFCESGQVQGTNTCSINLSGLLRAQLQYYDFQNNLVYTGGSFSTFNAASSTLSGVKTKGVIIK